MSSLPMNLEMIKQKFWLSFRDSFSPLGFQPLSSETTLICRFDEGHIALLLEFNPFNRDKLDVRVGFGITHYLIEEYYAEFINAPFLVDNVPMRVLIGGRIKDFVKGKIAKGMFEIIDTETHPNIISGIKSDYLEFVAPYFQRLLQKDGILTEFRNPSQLTKRLVSSRVTMSQELMIAAYLTEDKALFQEILQEEEVKHKDKMPDSYGGYSKLIEFLAKKDAARNS